MNDISDRVHADSGTSEHRCNAYCTDDTHVRLMYTNEDPPRNLRVGTSWTLRGRWLRVVKIERASAESDPPPGRPPGYDFPWLVWTEEGNTA